ncbi:hypothetical protein DPEC_G00239030 [Dallia pectoralis]|uniref:Uncharacterized protein n=1 Tax=Dallia pectoralis TaxID=75939 RepID=A0ACC2FYZ3_DALPE|nr:hypothetical protein DPEC_G00239030 [Dallia pectoralis]
MPKGFLIKRSKKPGPVSYRLRPQEDSVLVVNCSHSENAPVQEMPPVAHNFIRVPSRDIFGGVPKSQCDPTQSPTRCASRGHRNPQGDAALQMISSLCAQTETFPEASLGSFANDGSPVSPSLPEMTTKMDTMCGNAQSVAVKRHACANTKTPRINHKKRKSSPNQEKRCSVRDEVTTSPVLGLRIMEQVDDEVKQRSNTGSPLGEFICQLCLERYADPTTLAFHKCSRIVRVEYRCDECDKVFSCPANLASHRRWHKPKGFQVDRVSSHREERQPDVALTRDALPLSPPASDSGSDEEIMFSCQQCSKKFRKQAYLRKHLALHNRKAASPPQNQTRIPEQQQSIPPEACPESPEACPESPELSAKVSGMESLTKVSGEVFPCRFCGDNLFSSPGLTRHINKYHPTESRQLGEHDATVVITKQTGSGCKGMHTSLSIILIWSTGSASHQSCSADSKPPASKRLFPTCEAIDRNTLKMLIEKDRQRQILQQRSSSRVWLRAWGALQDWAGQLTRIIGAFTEHRRFDQFILFVVAVNTATLVAQTFESATVRGGWFFSAIDAAFLSIYLMECVLKLFTSGRLYFKNPWNALDFFIIIVSLVDFIFPLIESLGSFSGDHAATVFRIFRSFKGIRAIRAFRVLRTFSCLQNIRSIMTTCLQSLQSMGAIVCLMFIFLIMFAIIFREMFSVSDPERFGTMFRTVFTLFQVLTLDDWSLIYTTSRDQGAPHIIVFLVMYIVVEYFTLLNVFVAVLVDNFQLTIKKRMASKIEKFQDAYKEEIQSMNKLELQPGEPKTEEQFYEECLKMTYNENKYGKREIELLTSYLRLLAAMEQKQQTFRSQGCVLERLIDTFFEAREENTLVNEDE